MATSVIVKCDKCGATAESTADSPNPFSGIRIVGNRAATTSGDEIYDVCNNCVEAIRSEFHHS